MNVTAQITFEVDPDVWEGAGYDPLSPNATESLDSIASWLHNVLFMGSDHVPLIIDQIGLSTGRRVIVNATRAGFHIVTLASDGGGTVHAEDAEGNSLASCPKSDPSRVVGGNFTEYVKLLDQALAQVDARTRPTG